MEPLFDLTGRVAVVTGSLGLLGKQHALALASAGARVVVTDLNADGCRSFASQLPGNALGLAADITSKQSVTNLRDTILKETGRIDILVNNAAINDQFENPKATADLSRFENYPVELFEKSLQVNILGTFLCCQVLGTVMAEAGKGSIINIASTYGMNGPDQSIYIRPDGSQPFFKPPAYSTTKGGIIAFTKFLAAYWGNRGVRVNTLSPGGVENNQDDFFINNYSRKTMLGRMAAPTDYHGAVVFLASDASAYMTGANLVVDGGWTAW
ncbi:MAG: SDR family oxidoreductase [Bacteroidetes bacterium]|nr:SDR family oxidoreductase [Bacteroidota bacterium]